MSVSEQMSAISHHPSWSQVLEAPRIALPSGSVSDSTSSWDVIRVAPSRLPESTVHDVLKQTIWIPLLTFWQVTGDLPFATGVPAGHGHSYKSEYVDGWNAVMRAGLTQDQLASLREIISAVNQ